MNPTLHFLAICLLGTSTAGAGDQTRIAQFGNYAAIQSAGGSSGTWLSGALSRMNTTVPVDLVTIRLGPAVPKIWRAHRSRRLVTWSDE
jgi:hypothetical protein